MLILTSTSDKIRAVLSTAVTTNQLNCYSSYKDTTSSAISPLRNALNTNSTTPVDLVGSPAASTQRVVDFLSVYNNDTTAKTVTISLYNGTTDYTLFKAALGIGECVIYQEGYGFYINSAVGGRRLTVNQPVGSLVASVPQITVLAADVTNNNAVANTIQDVTGLGFTMQNTYRYYFRFVIFYTAAATGTGSRWSINASAGTASVLTYNSEYSLTTTTSTRNAQSIVFNSPSGCNASSAATGANHATIEGVITANADATLTATFASEVSGSAIVAKAGSFVMYQRLL